MLVECFEDYLQQLRRVAVEIKYIPDNTGHTLSRIVLQEGRDQGRRKKKQGGGGWWRWWWWRRRRRRTRRRRKRRRRKRRRGKEEREEVVEEEEEEEEERTRGRGGRYCYVQTNVQIQHAGTI